jgi:hypothetical protein
MSSESAPPEEPRYTLSLTPPRQPEAYRITDHFRQRLKRRKNPTITGDIVRRCIEDGQLKRTQVSHHFFFELQLDYRFRVVVALRDEAFLEQEEKHRALSVYAVDSDHAVEEGWRP